jgi:hypothetical protein
MVVPALTRRPGISGGSCKAWLAPPMYLVEAMNDELEHPVPGGPPRGRNSGPGLEGQDEAISHNTYYSTHW